MTQFQLKNLTKYQQEWIDKLKSDEYGQKKIFDSIVSLEDLNSIIQQLEDVSKSYSPGVLGYIQNVRNLFQSYSTNSKIVDNFDVHIPPSYRYEPASKEFLEMETIGLSQLDSVVFVLVAGGLGERLGSTQPKVLLPIESITETSFLQFYIQLILAWESYSKIHLNVITQIPLVIMTSEDTHQNTKVYLEEHNYFGLHCEQIYFLKQNKVPAFSNSQAEFSLGRTQKGVLFIETKPHGHGDVHYLLWKSGFIKKWVKEGKKSLFLFQDTNALMFYALPLLLGVSFTNSLTMNFLAISRKSGEAVGAMCELVPKNNTIFGGSSRIVNIEYNQFEKLYDTSGIAFDAIHPLTGNSVFPGNANVLLFNLKRYGDILEKTTGIVPEFVNPKYIDEKTNQFLTSGRLECLMQDFPYLLEKTDKVAVTEVDRWLCFTTVKNSIDLAATKAKKNLPLECMFSAEADFYTANRKYLQLAAQSNGFSSEIALPQPKTLGKITYPLGPKVVILPSFAFSFKQIKEQIKGSLYLESNSSLVLDGHILLNDIHVNGALIVRSRCKEFPLILQNIKVANKGFHLFPISQDNQNEAEKSFPNNLRGYFLKKDSCTCICL